MTLSLSPSQQVSIYNRKTVKGVLAPRKISDLAAVALKESCFLQHIQSVSSGAAGQAVTPVAKA